MEGKRKRQVRVKSVLIQAPLICPCRFRDRFPGPAPDENFHETISLPPMDAECKRVGRRISVGGRISVDSAEKQPSFSVAKLQIMVRRFALREEAHICKQKRHSRGWRN